MPPKRRPGSLSTKSLKSIFDITLNETTDNTKIKELIRHLNEKFLRETAGETQSTARDRASKQTSSNKQAFSIQQLYSVVTHLKKEGRSDEDIRNISIEEFVKTHIDILMKAGKKKKCLKKRSKRLKKRSKHLKKRSKHLKKRTNRKIKTKSRKRSKHLKKRTKCKRKNS